MTTKCLLQEVLNSFNSKQRLLEQMSHLEGEVQQLEKINNHYVNLTTNSDSISASHVHQAIAGLGTVSKKGAQKTGMAKPTKRKSGGCPASVGVSLGGSGDKRLQEKLEMKENLDSFSHIIRKLKTEVTAALMGEGIDGAPGSATIASSGSAATLVDPLLLQGSVSSIGAKEEQKFQPPDLSIKGLLEKTKTVPNSAIKQEAAALSSSHMSSPAPAGNSSVYSRISIKTEIKDMLNGVKKRKLANSDIVRHTMHQTPGVRAVDGSQGSKSESKTFIQQKDIPDRNIMASALLPVISPIPIAQNSLSNQCENTSSLSLSDKETRARLSLAQDLILLRESSFEQTLHPAHGGTSVASSSSDVAKGVSMGAVTSDAGSLSGDKSSAESHRVENNYSPISRPSSQSSTECAPAFPGLAAAPPNVGEISVGQSLPACLTELSRPSHFTSPSIKESSPARLVGPALPVPGVTVTVGLGTVSGGNVSKQVNLGPLSMHDYSANQTIGSPGSIISKPSKITQDGTLSSSNKQAASQRNQSWQQNSSSSAALGSSRSRSKQPVISTNTASLTSVENTPTLVLPKSTPAPVSSCSVTNSWKSQTYPEVHNHNCSTKIVPVEHKQQQQQQSRTGHKMVSLSSNGINAVVQMLGTEQEMTKVVSSMLGSSVASAGMAVPGAVQVASLNTSLSSFAHLQQSQQSNCQKGESAFSLSFP